MIAVKKQQQPMLVVLVEMLVFAADGYLSLSQERRMSSLLSGWNNPGVFR